MTNHKFNAVFLLLALMCAAVIIGCKPKESEQALPPGVDPIPFDQIADKLVELSDLQSGEKVLFMMVPGRFDGLVESLSEKVEAKGSQYLGTLSMTPEQPVSWSTDFTEQCTSKSLEELKEIFQEVDLGIMLPGAVPSHIPYKALQEILVDNDIKRTIHFHWAGAYDLNGNLLDNTPMIDEFYADVILNTDYEALKQKQINFEASMRDQVIRVTTPAGTDISFRIGDRPVTKQDGEASASRAQTGKNLIDREVEIPAGAIRVAPIEESVDGKIAFPDAIWAGESVKGLIVTIEKGKIIDLEAEENESAVLNEIENAGDSGSSFREFALGFNPLMPLQSSPMDWIPYYGYGAGIVRLSLGDNLELGGQVGGGYVRWNFFTDATVMVGEELWVEEGMPIK